MQLSRVERDGIIKPTQRVVSPKVTPSHPPQSERKVVKLENGLFKVISGKEEYYTDIQNKICTCKGWFYGKKRDKSGLRICRHLIECRGLK